MPHRPRRHLSPEACRSPKANALGVLVPPLPAGPAPPNPIPADGCAATPPGTYTGMIVLIRRGTCGFYQKARLAQLGGASAVALYNNCNPNCGRFSPTVAIGPGADGLAVTIPWSPSTGPQGHRDPQRDRRWCPDVELDERTRQPPEPTGGTISSFSSFGLGGRAAAQAGHRRAGRSHPLDVPARARHVRHDQRARRWRRRTWRALRRCSSRQHPGTSPSDLRASSRTAPTRRSASGSASGQRAPSGCRHARHRRRDPRGRRSCPGKISLGEGNGGTAKIQLRNSSGSPVTYDLTHEPAAGTTNTFAPRVLDRLRVGELLVVERDGAGQRRGERLRDDHAERADARQGRLRRVRDVHAAGRRTGRTACRTPGSRATTSRSRC